MLLTSVFASRNTRRSHSPGCRVEKSYQVTLLMSAIVDEVWLSPGMDLRRIKVSQFSGPPMLAFHEMLRSREPCNRFFPRELSINTPAERRRVSRVFVQDKGHSLDTLLWPPDPRICSREIFPSN